MKKFVKKVLLSLSLLASVICTQNSYAGNTLSLTVKATDINGNVTTTSSPAAILAIQNIKTIQVILTGTISSYTVTDTSYSVNNWGVFFTGANGNSITCTTRSPCENATITVNQNGLPALPSGSSPYTFTNAAATIDVSIAFSTPTTNLPQSFQTLLASTPVTVGYKYDSSTATGVANGPDTATWQADVGTLLNGPVLQMANKSVIAKDGAFQVTNISAPTSLTAVCPSTNGTTCNTSNDGSGTGATLITSTTPTNSVTGYVIAYWKDSTCKIGGFSFSPNWMAYSYNSGNPYAKSTCVYPGWVSGAPSAGGTGTGGTSSALGCNGLSTLPTFLTGSVLPSPLTGDTAAIPYINVSGNPKADLRTLIANPGRSYTSSANDSCVNYVYLSNSGGSQASYTSGTITNGDVYGVTVWALNGASDPTYNTPNYSLNHSNVFYTTGVNFVLASTQIDPSLSKSKDCFVVTAASGNVDSPAVFYWRLLRDAYLTPLGITKIYYKHAQSWAHWLDEHPRLKPAMNFIFEKSGYALYYSGEFIKTSSRTVNEKVHKLFHWISSLLDNSASAQELPKNFAFTQVPAEARERTNFGLEQNNQKNINVIPEELANDPFFRITPKKTGPVFPNTEFSIKGGVLMPTDDQEYYDAYYSSKPTIYGELGVGKLFWWNHVGFSLGAQARYTTNSQSDSITVLNDAPEDYTRTFYAVSAEILAGMRYRNPHFLYLQPGFYFAGGVSRLRESASPSGSSGNNDNGVTEYSAIYEAGVNLDLSLSAITGQKEADQDDVLNEVLLRFSGSFNNNPTNGLSTSGYFVGGGFVFLIN